jgi:hypothetical protein
LFAGGETLGGCPFGIPLCSLVFQPKVANLSSYDEGTVGGDSPRLIRLLGELEYAGTFFAHSVVFWAKAADDIASNKGDVTGFSIVAEAAGFASGKREGVAAGLGFLLSSLSQDTQM